MKKQFMKAASALLASAILFTASCKKPASSFTADKTDVAVGEAVTFTNTSEKGKLVAWDFGDGTGSSTTAKTITHVYQKPGAYNVNLMVAKKNGKKPSDATAITVTVRAAVADFTVSNASPVAGEVVTFKSTATDASSFEWDFGDGASGGGDRSNSPWATHIYSTGGTYTVVLKVSDASGASVSTSTKTVTVGGGASGNIANKAMIVGTWKLKTIVTTDVRNGSTFTTTGGSIPSKNLTTTFSNNTYEYTSSGTVVTTDETGDIDSDSYSIWDANRISNVSIKGVGNSAWNYTKAYAYSGNSSVFSTYTLTATSLVITYTAVNASLPAYCDGTCNVSPFTNHNAGEKQVVTTVFTFEK